MVFYILDKNNSIKFLSYIDCTGIIPIGIDMCPIDVCVILWHIRNKISLILVALCMQLSPYNMLRIRIFTLLIHFRFGMNNLAIQRDA
jgi:hypothetical protein